MLKQKVTNLVSRKLKVTNIRTIIGRRTECKGIRVLRGQRHIPSKNSPKEDDSERKISCYNSTIDD